MTTFLATAVIIVTSNISDNEFTSDEHKGVKLSTHRFRNLQPIAVYCSRENSKKRGKLLHMFSPAFFTVSAIAS